MSKTVELIFDFVSPNAYLIWQPLNALVEKCSAELEITPVFLGGMHKLTGNAPPMIRDAEVKGKNEYAMLEMQRFIKKHGLTKFSMNPKFPFNSIKLQRLLLTADQGRRARLIRALQPAVWEEGLDVTDDKVLIKILTDAGYDAKGMLGKTQDATVKQQLADNTEKAVERGAFGIPTMYVEGEMYFGKERLGQIEEQLTN